MFTVVHGGSHAADFCGACTQSLEKPLKCWPHVALMMHGWLLNSAIDGVICSHSDPIRGN